MVVLFERRRADNEGINKKQRERERERERVREREREICIQARSQRIERDTEIVKVKEDGEVSNGGKGLWRRSGGRRLSKAEREKEQRYAGRR